MKSPAEADHIFGQYGPTLRRAGFAVLPSQGKAPLMSGFNKWKHAPGPAVVDKWAEKHRDADIVYVPGLSRTKRLNPLIVVDGDDEEACERITEVFGATPGKVRTRRGRHFLYEDRDGRSLGKLSSLRKFGIEADIKHGQHGAGIVAASGSTHEKDRTFRYGWEDCDETVINHLLPFNFAALEKMTGQARPRFEEEPQQVEQQNAAPINPHLRNGSRKLTINDHIYRDAWSFASESEMIAAAFQSNHEIGCVDPRGPLDADEVMTIARAVWRDREAGKIEKLAGAKSREKLHRQALTLLSRLDPRRATDAYALFLLLCDEHAARCRRGESFAISAKRMAQTSVIPEWDHRRYERARDLLLAAGLIAKVAEFQNTAEGRSAAQFVLTHHKGGAPAAGQGIVALGSEIVPGLLLDATWGGQ